MIFPDITTLSAETLAKAQSNMLPTRAERIQPQPIDGRIAANVGHLIRTPWIDDPWPMTRDRWESHWAFNFKHAQHELPVLNEFQFEALVEAYAYALAADVPQDGCAAAIIAILGAVGFDTLAEHVSSPFTGAPGTESATEGRGSRQRAIILAVREAPGIEREAMIEELVADIPKGVKGGKRRNYRLSLAALIAEGALTERGGRLYIPGLEFNDLIGA